MKRILLALALAYGLVPSASATINTSSNKVIAACNGSAASFNFTFPGVAAGDISVIFTNSSGVATTLANTLYTLVLNAPTAGQIWGLGGTVTYPLIGGPCATGGTVTIVRSLANVQSVVYANQGPLIPQSIETGLDLLEMQIQQNAEALTRIVQAPVSDPPGLNLTLPPAAQRANTGLAFDGAGNIIAGTVPTGGTISSAMQPVVNAASLAAGRTAFGLGSMAVENINGGTLGGPSLQDDGAGNARVATTTVADATNTSVTCNFHLNQRVATGPFTYTLPRANICFNGFTFYVYVVPTGSAVTLTPNANDNFDGVASGTSITLNAGSWARIWTNAASSGTWHINGTDNLGNAMATTMVVGDGSIASGTGSYSIFTSVTASINSNTHQFGCFPTWTWSASGSTGSNCYDDEAVVKTANAGVTINHHASFQSFATFAGPGTLSAFEVLNSEPQVTGGTVGILAHLLLADASISGGATVSQQLGINCAIVARTADRCLFLSGLSELRGHLVAGGTSPTLSGCGTSPSIAGNDNAGNITTGTGSPTGCTLTFVNAFQATPACWVAWASGPLAAMSWSESLTQLTITQTATSNTRLSYGCWDTI